MWVTACQNQARTAENRVNSGSPTTTWFALSWPMSYSLTPHSNSSSSLSSHRVSRLSGTSVLRPSRNAFTCSSG